VFYCSLYCSFFLFAWPQISLGDVGDDRKELPLFPESERALRTCAFLSFPGDIILQRYEEGDLETFGGKKFVYATYIQEVLSLNLQPRMQFSHADFIDRIDSGADLQSIGYYPHMFNDPGQGGFRKQHSGDLFDREYFAIYRSSNLQMNDQMQKRNKALNMARNSLHKYHGFGTCSDFVSWLFDNEFTSWWNMLPGLRKIIESVYPPEGITTPDDIAHSPFSHQICSVNASQYFGPRSVCTKDLIIENNFAISTQNNALVEHALWRNNFLRQNGFIANDGSIQISKIDLLPPLSNLELAEKRQSCQACRLDALKNTPRSLDVSKCHTVCENLTELTCI
jgi:hypothetical protein